MGDIPFCSRCWCSALALAIMLLSIEALALPAKLDEGCNGFLALPKSPMVVEFGFMLRGSEIDRNEGIRLGSSSGLSGDSRGVLGSEDSSEPGDVGT